MTIFIVCDPRCFLDAIQKVNLAFLNSDAIPVASFQELDAILKIREPIKGQTGILAVDDFPKEWEYRGFPCAPIHYSKTERNAVCTAQDCWRMPIDFLRGKIQGAIIQN